jgi:hypothetical protein
MKYHGYELAPVSMATNTKKGIPVTTSRIIEDY